MLPRVEIKKKLPQTAVVHCPCSAKKMGLEKRLIDIAEGLAPSSPSPSLILFVFSSACAESVVYPPLPAAAWRATRLRYPELPDATGLTLSELKKTVDDKGLPSRGVSVAHASTSCAGWGFC